MMWLTWRQFRAQAIVAGAALVAVAIVLMATEPHLASLFDSSGLATCRASCESDASTFFSQVGGSATELIFYGGILLLYAVPALIGLFWGAPLVTREFEAGTFRLAWNQSVPRARWIGVKLGLLGLGAVVVAGLLSLMTAWWASPFYQAARDAGGQNPLSITRFAPPLFSASGVAPVGYAVFAFSLGVTVGVLVRRTLPAMAITLALFAAIQILWPTLVRPHLIPPVQATQALSTVNLDGFGIRNNGQLFLQVGSVNGRAGSWILSSRPVNAVGQPVTMAPSACAQANTFEPCLASHGIQIQVRYQPESRYWPFQWLETGIFLTAALGLGGLCYWRIRRVA
jgi:hypothetical protein